MAKPKKEVRKLKKNKSVSHGAYVTLPKLEPEVKKVAPKKPEEEKPKGFDKVNKSDAPKSRKFATGTAKKEPEKQEPEKKEPTPNPFLHVVIKEESTTTKDGLEKRPFKGVKQEPKEGDLENFVSSMPKIPGRLIFEHVKEAPEVLDPKKMKVRKIDPPAQTFKKVGTAKSAPLNPLKPKDPAATVPLSALAPASTNNLAWPRSPEQASAAFGTGGSSRAGANNPRSNRSYVMPTMFPQSMSYAAAGISGIPGQGGTRMPYGTGSMGQGTYNSMRFNSGAMPGMAGAYGTMGQARSMYPYSYNPYGMYGYGAFAQRYPGSNPYQSDFGRFPQSMYASPYMPYGYNQAFASRYGMPPGPNRAAQSQGKPLVDSRSIEESTIFDKPPVSIEEGMKTADKTRSKKRNGLILTMVAMLLIIAVGIGYLVYTDQLDLSSVLGDAVPAQDEGDGEDDQGSSSSKASSSSQASSSSSSSASASAGSVVYQYTALTADGTAYTVQETVTFDSQGTCEFTTMEMEFPDEAACKTYVDSLQNDYGSKLTVDSMDGAKATVTIDNSSLHLDRDEYENTLRYSVQDLVILRK